MNRISFLNRGYAFKGLLAVKTLSKKKIPTQPENFGSVNSKQTYF